MSRLETTRMEMQDVLQTSGIPALAQLYPLIENNQHLAPPDMV